ncbi:hypothetical protein Axy20_047 [Achromobacter phage vB_AxyS_19-32_Axy20]|nr:hypothetical protein Axy19_046 [Achromobacter phage vB_AxyS_19-32_Axy19]QDH84490.1 hypothetical protein Axy20_047 [Achromobacter phage vB_AxyS_19-32_Axy20]
MDRNHAYDNALKIMFFTKGAIPTPEEDQAIKDVQMHKFGIVVRDSRIPIGPGQPKEECTHVLGDVIPAAYADKPKWEAREESGVPIGTPLTIFDAETGQSAPTQLQAMPDQSLGCMVPKHNVLLTSGQKKTVVFNNIIGDSRPQEVEFDINDNTGHLERIKFPQNSQVTYAQVGGSVTSFEPSQTAWDIVDIQFSGRITIRSTHPTVAVHTTSRVLSLDYAANPRITTRVAVRLPVNNRAITAIELTYVDQRIISRSRNRVKMPDGKYHFFTFDENCDIVVGDEDPDFPTT